MFLILEIECCDIIDKLIKSMIIFYVARKRQEQWKQNLAWFFILCLFVIGYS